MAQSHDLAGLMEEWWRCTQQETKALRARDWPEVESCQRAKEALCARLDAGPASSATSPETERLIAEITLLESQNLKWLQSQMAELRRQGLAAEASIRNLRRVRQSYAPAENSSWHSYS